MHPLVQDGDDADISVREVAPIDVMVFVAEEISLDAELGRDGARERPVGSDAIERREQAGD